MLTRGNVGSLCIPGAWLYGSPSQIQPHPSRPQSFTGGWGSIGSLSRGESAGRRGQGKVTTALLECTQGPSRTQDMVLSIMENVWEFLSCVAWQPGLACQSRSLWGGSVRCLALGGARCAEPVTRALPPPPPLLIGGISCIPRRERRKRNAERSKSPSSSLATT